MLKTITPRQSRFHQERLVLRPALEFLVEPRAEEWCGDNADQRVDGQRGDDEEVERHGVPGHDAEKHRAEH